MLEAVTGFEWDKHNADKNWEKHGVSNVEAEQAFFNQPLLLFEDRKHSKSEARSYVLGQTDAGRLLMIVFTIRGDKIRVISAREMSRKEKRIYERQEKETDSGISE